MYHYSPLHCCPLTVHDVNEGITHAVRDEWLWQSAQVGLDHGRNIVDGVLVKVVKVCSENLRPGVCVYCMWSVCVYKAQGMHVRSIALGTLSCLHTSAVLSPGCSEG